MSLTAAESVHRHHSPLCPNALADILEGLSDGSVVPCLGPGALTGVVDSKDQSPIPADSNSLILSMTGGQPMSPKLMFEFSRAAMHVENKKGRNYIERFLTRTYGERTWTQSLLHRRLADRNLPYVIDCNRDTQLQTLYADRRYTLIVGTARLGGTHYRFHLYQWEGDRYRPITQPELDPALPILFKPLGSPWPKPTYVASDADFVDYFTELMGGFAIPEAVKRLRLDKRYVMLGMNFTRDTERMLVSDLIYGAAAEAGWALIEGATAKEQQFCARQRLSWVDADWQGLMG